MEMPKGNWKNWRKREISSAFALRKMLIIFETFRNLRNTLIYPMLIGYSCKFFSKTTEYYSKSLEIQASND